MLHNAVIFCEGSFSSTYGKTTHGLVRFSERYESHYVIDSQLVGQDAGTVLDNKESGILIVKDLNEALLRSRDKGIKLSHFVVGIATDGGYLDDKVKDAVLEALGKGLNVDSGLHEFVSDIPGIESVIKDKNIEIRDTRKPKAGRNHIFTGEIENVESIRIATMGTDSAIGKRTSAWMLVHALRKAGKSAQMIGTGQTAWMQGAEYGIILDSLLNDYISGELEYSICTAWNETHMEYAIIEGQGSLMNPGYPGGFEILAAGRPHGILMQHAPMRKEYDGFPGYPLDSLNDQIHIAEFLSKKPVIAVTVNHEGLQPDEIDGVCKELEKTCGRKVIDPLYHGMDSIVPLVLDLKK